MLGSSTRDHILPTKKQLSKLLVVNKGHEKLWWDGYYRYVVLPQPGSFLLAVVDVFLNDGPGQIGVRIMSNHPKAQCCSCASWGCSEMLQWHVFSTCTTPGISPAVQAANATSCGISPVCAMAEVWRKVLVCLTTKDPSSSSCHQASSFVLESLGIQVHLRHLPLPSTLPRLE